MRLNVNTAEVVKNTARLERMHRSAFPVAVRGTLNNAAFDVKQKTMQKTSQKYFTNRQKNFFKANSRVEMAKGFNVKSMKATIGFTEGKLKGGSNFAVKDLQQQEHGGTIKGRALIALEGARVSKSWEKVPSKKGKIENLPSLVDSQDARGKSDAERYTKSAIHAGQGGYVIGNKRKKGSRKVYRIRKIKRQGNKTVVVSDPMFSVQKGRTVKVKKRPFMRDASKMSAKKLEMFFNQQAERQFKKYR